MSQPSLRRVLTLRKAGQCLGLSGSTVAGLSGRHSVGGLASLVGAARAAFLAGGIPAVNGSAHPMFEILSHLSAQDLLHTSDASWANIFRKFSQ